jgi:hypothetical protein
MAFCVAQGKLQTTLGATTPEPWGKDKKPHQLSMKTYIYHDNVADETLAIIPADSITEADEAFEAAYGKHPSKMPHIGCTIHKPSPHSCGYVDP